MASLKYKPRIIKIRCPGNSIESRNGVVKSFDLDDEQEAGWPEIEPIILGWLELADSEELCLTPKFLSYVAQISVGFATERLEALYEKDMVFKSIDDGTEMFCFEDPDDFDDDPDDPDGGESVPIDLGGANNEEFYPLDTRKVANDMLKELIKMAGEFDRLGLSKEADEIDAMISKFAGDLDDELTTDEPTQDGFPQSLKAYSDYSITLDELISKLNELRGTVPGDTRVFSPSEDWGIRRIHGAKVMKDSLVSQDVSAQDFDWEKDDDSKYRKTIVEIF